MARSASAHLDVRRTRRVQASGDRPSPTRAGRRPALLETGGGTPALGGQEQSARIREIRARLLTLPPEEYPHIVEAAAYLSEAPDPDWAFQLGLDLLIGGLEKILKPESRASRQRAAAQPVPSPASASPAGR